MQQEPAQIPQMSHYTFPSSWRAVQRFVLPSSFITNTMFHWQQRTAEICHNKHGIMLIYHNNYDKNKGKKVKELEFPVSTCVEMLTFTLTLKSYMVASSP